MRAFFSFIVGAIAAVALLVFALFAIQNTQSAHFTFAGSAFSIGLVWLVLVPALIGFLLALLIVTPARMGFDRQHAQMRGEERQLSQALDQERARNAEQQTAYTQLQARYASVTAERDQLKQRLQSVASAAAPVAGAGVEMRRPVERPVERVERETTLSPTGSAATYTEQTEQVDRQPTLGERLRGAFNRPATNDGAVRDERYEDDNPRDPAATA